MTSKHFLSKKFFSLLISILFSCSYASSQVEYIKQYPSAKDIKKFEHTGFRLIYYTDPNVSTYRDVHAVSLPKLKEFRFNPTGNSFAAIHGKGLDIYSFEKQDQKLFSVKDKRKIKSKPLPISLAYSPDARNFLAGYSNGEIIVYDTKTYLPQFILQGEAPATRLLMSPNNYFIAAITGKNIDIWNFETKSIRYRLELPVIANDLAFSVDGSLLAVTTENQIIIYNTRDWEVFHAALTDQPVTSPSFNVDDKYLAFKQGNDEIVIFNIRKKEVTQIIKELDLINACQFFDNKGDGKSYMMSNRKKAIVIWNANGLNPFYGKILNQEVDQKMNEWVKMMQDESMEDYKIRVNEETRIKQVEAFSQEVATGLAGDRIAIENPFVGDYDEGAGLLAINFTSLPPIDIPVPASELDNFKDNDKLKFGNAVYTLNSDDEFVLAYIEVTNEVTNKVYIYDNIGRTRLESIEADLNFVPLEVLQIASQEESNLVQTTEKIVAENKQEKLITDNTQIDVKTEVLTDVDADGNKILNYQINYKYEVINKEFSEKEDFPSGGYDITKSNAALSLMSIIKSSFEEGDFAKYMESGKRVRISITGSADGSPIRGKIAYNGSYGDFVDEPYYQNGEMNSMTITKASGVTTNPQLAFLRAASVADYLSNNISSLQQTRNDYVFNINVAEERGGEFRRIQIQFTIIDTFK